MKTFLLRSLILLGLFSSGVVSLSTSVFAAPPTITAPEKIYGEVNDWIFFNATTDGKGLKVVSLDKNVELFPSNKLKDPTENGVKARKAGTYTLLIYTGNADGPSEPKYLIFVVGNGGTDDKVDPVIVDPLVKSLSDTYKIEDPSDKLTSLKALTDSFNDAITFAKDTTITTNQMLANKVAQRVAEKVDGKIPNMRKVVSQYMNDNLPKPLTQLDQATRDKFVGVYQKIIDSLNKVK